ncbi:hypothetical protein SPF06_21475 [Sinomonas sp. JGH33]|uniref:Type II secretion system protein GspF domain-containing protein n=1 Tax=Sinomonas terricola TaxID=3110330 RepID=A0ABU5TDY3_9MICC|nr:hypothetical protein [Sinomonas sp. JGH33]MEA5457296.1 hypothetical protein [Sinomonas sp. JGH33]
MTGAVLAVLCAAGITLGILVVVLGATGARLGTRKRRGPGAWARLKARFGPRGAWALVIGISAGVLLFARTGWVVVLVAAPLAAFILPALFSNADQRREVERLEGLESWSRALASLVATGSMSLSRAIVASLPNAPASIETEVTNLVARLSARWRTRDALRAFADDIDDPTGDLLATRLILASQIQVSSLSNALTDLAHAIQEEVTNRREIEAQRETNRTTARSVTIINVVLLGGAATIFADYFSFYREPVGQLVVALIFAAYGAVLLWMRSMSAIRTPPRLFAAPDHDGETADAVGEQASSLTGRTIHRAQEAS